MVPKNFEEYDWNLSVGRVSARFLPTLFRSLNRAAFRASRPIAPVTHLSAHDNGSH